MEKLLNPYDKEYMKMEMLKHEETFREQVYELHRLYQIQKLLMKNISSSKHRQELDRWNFASATNSNKMINDDHQDIHKKPRQYLDLERPAEEFRSGTEGRSMLEIEDESELELTLGPTSQCRRRKTLETLLASDSAASLSSSSTGSNLGNHHRINTTRGNHQKINTTTEELMGRKWSLDIPSSSVPGFLSGRKNSSDVEEQLRHDRHTNAPWLLQALSLNTS